MCFKRLLSGQDGRLTYSNSNLGQAGVVRVDRVKAHISEPKTSPSKALGAFFCNFRPLGTHLPNPECVSPLCPGPSSWRPAVETPAIFRV